MLKIGNERVVSAADMVVAADAAKSGIAWPRKPQQGEAFRTFAKECMRGSAYDFVDSLMYLLLVEGYDHPSRREYLARLEAARDILTEVRNRLYTAWSEPKPTKEPDQTAG